MRKKTADDTQGCCKCQLAGAFGLCGQGECISGAGAVECGMEGETTGCGNQRLHLQQTKRVFVSRSGGGHGCFLAEKASEGDLLVEYMGVFRNELEGHNEYTMAVPGGFIVAKTSGNESRFINHSCCGNAVPTVWTVQGAYRVGVFATKEIAAGEEIKMDYSWRHLGGEKTVCNCGELGCRGELGGVAQAANPRKPDGSRAAESKPAAKSKGPAAPRLRTSKGGTVVLRPEKVAASPCSTKEQELLEDGSKLGTPQKGGPDSGAMEALTDEQRSKLERHLAEETGALQEKAEDQGDQRGQTRKRLEVGKDRGAVAEAPD